MYEAILISKTDAPVSLEYKGKGLVLSPRGNVNIEKIEDLKLPLPEKVVLKKLNVEELDQPLPENVVEVENTGE